MVLPIVPKPTKCARPLEKHNHAKHSPQTAGQRTGSNTILKKSLTPTAHILSGDGLGHCTSGDARTRAQGCSTSARTRPATSHSTTLQSGQVLNIAYNKTSKQSTRQLNSKHDGGTNTAILIQRQGNGVTIHETGLMKYCFGLPPGYLCL